MVETRKSFNRRWLEPPQGLKKRYPSRPRPQSPQLNISRIRKRMEVLGLSQNKLADAVGMTPGAISRVMARKRGVSPKTALRLAEVLGLDRAELFSQFNVNRIRERMEVLGLSQNKLADAVGMTPGALSRVMARKSGISPTTAQRFAKVLGLDRAELFGTPVDLDKASEVISQGAWSISELAHAIGVTPDHLALTLQRLRNLTPDAWKRLADVLGLEYEGLVVDSVPKPGQQQPSLSPAKPNAVGPVAARKRRSRCERCGSIMLLDEFGDPSCVTCGYADYTKAKPGPPSSVRPTIPESSGPAGFQNAGGRFRR